MSIMLLELNLWNYMGKYLTLTLLMPWCCIHIVNQIPIALDQFKTTIAIKIKNFERKKIQFKG